MWNGVTDAAGSTQLSSTQPAGDNRGGLSWSETVDLSWPQSSATVPYCGMGSKVPSDQLNSGQFNWL